MSGTRPSVPPPPESVWRPVALMSLAEVVQTRWWRRANCAEATPELFFPGRGESTAEAIAVCAGCEVRVECLQWALLHPEKYGIWGGMSERERRRIRPRWRQLRSVVAS